MGGRHGGSDECYHREPRAAKQKEWATRENEPQEPVGAEEVEEEFLKEQKHLTQRRKIAISQRKKRAFTFERGRWQKKNMLEIDIGSGNVIENTRNADILSCYPTDILDYSEQFLMEITHLGVLRSRFFDAIYPEFRSWAWILPS